MASLWVPFFVSLKHFLQCDSFCFFLGELSAPGYALVCCSALAGILELQIASCLFALFLQALYGAVDLMVVGKFALAQDVSGVAVGSQIMHTVTGLISSLAMGDPDRPSAHRLQP